MKYLDNITEHLLVTEYCENKKSMLEIANEQGCSQNAIYYHLKKFELPIRSSSETRMGGTHKIIPTKEELTSVYCVGNKTAVEIAKYYGCSYTTIYNYLRRYNIHINTCSEIRRKQYLKNICIPTSFATIIDGLLLGDGNLSSPTGFQARYNQNSSIQEFIDVVSNIFKVNNYFKSSGYRSVYDNRTCKHYDNYYFHSECTSELMVIYNKWYADGKKCVPKDIKLTPNTVLFWYLSDGNKSSNSEAAVLCTDAFLLSEQNFLISLFKDIGILVSIQKHCDKYRLFINTHEFPKFIQYMCTDVLYNPVSCYDYKFSFKFKNSTHMDEVAKVGK